MVVRRPVRGAGASTPVPARMPTVSVTTAELLAADAQLQAMAASGERLPPQLAVTLATLQRRIQSHVGDARQALQGYLDEYGARGADGTFQHAPNGGVLIAPAHQAAYQEAERGVMQATHTIDVPAIRLTDWPAHGAPPYGLIAALLPFAADADAGAAAPTAPA